MGNNTVASACEQRIDATAHRSRGRSLEACPRRHNSSAAALAQPACQDGALAHGSGHAARHTPAPAADPCTCTCMHVSVPCLALALLLLLLLSFIFLVIAVVAIG